jgi:hypothetical protein
MATMPGLPMFGHGQVEGFAERYGMEYRRAYWDEMADGYLVARHEREIFPLLHRRYLFAEVEDFLLYDFFTAPEGHVNECLRYSNRSGDERSLVVYNNRILPGAAGSALRSLFLKTAERSLELGPWERAGHTDDPDTSPSSEIMQKAWSISQQPGADRWGPVIERRLTNAGCSWTSARWDDQWRQCAQLNSYLNGNGV